MCTSKEYLPIHIAPHLPTHRPEPLALGARDPSEFSCKIKPHYQHHHHHHHHSPLSFLSACSRHLVNSTSTMQPESPSSSYLHGYHVALSHHHLSFGPMQQPANSLETLIICCLSPVYLTSLFLLSLHRLYLLRYSFVLKISSLDTVTGVTSFTSLFISLRILIKFSVSHSIFYNFKNPLLPGFLYNQAIRNCSCQNH